MRLDHDATPWCSLHNPFDGDVGSALYVSPTGITDAAQIRYRNLRLLAVGPASVCDEFPAIGDGPLGLDAHVALVKSPDSLNWAMPTEYLTTSFVVNVRPHQSGLELDGISGSQVVAAIGGEGSPAILGDAIVIQSTKLDGGGLRVWFRFVPGDGPQPDSFRVADVEVTTTIVPATISARSDNDYTVELSGLADGTNYSLAIIGITGSDETQLTTCNVTGDDDGPDTALILTAEEW